MTKDKFVWRCRKTEVHETTYHGETLELKRRCGRLRDHEGPCDFDPPRDPHGPDGFPAYGKES